jgi:hypothetical protein
MAGQDGPAAGHLSPDVKSFIAGWLSMKKSRPALIMKEMGFSGYDYRLAAAVKSGQPLRKEVLDPLRPWLNKNGFGK